MRDATEIILAPVVTEKTADQMEAASLYTFLVRPDANKIEIGQAVQQLWDVNVKSVRTVRYSGKVRRSHMGRMAKNNKQGRTAGYKKAMVQLAEGEHIELYEAG